MGQIASRGVTSARVVGRLLWRDGQGAHFSLLWGQERNGQEGRRAQAQKGGGKGCGSFEEQRGHLCAWRSEVSCDTDDATHKP